MRLKLFKAFGGNRSSLHMFITKHTLAAFSVPRLPAALQNNLPFSIRTVQRQELRQRLGGSSGHMHAAVWKALGDCISFSSRTSFPSDQQKRIHVSEKDRLYQPDPSSTGRFCSTPCLHGGICTREDRQPHTLQRTGWKKISYSDLQSERGVL